MWYRKSCCVHLWEEKKIQNDIYKVENPQNTIFNGLLAAIQYDSRTSGNMLILSLYEYIFFMKVVSFLLVVMRLKISRWQTYSLTTAVQPILCALTDRETLQQNSIQSKENEEEEKTLIDSNFIVHSKSKVLLNVSSDLHHLRFWTMNWTKFCRWKVRILRISIKNNINRHESRRNGKPHKISVQIK